MDINQTVILNLISGLICYLIIKDREKSGWWVYAGLVFNVIGILFCVVATSDREEKELISELKRKAIELKEQEFYQSVKLCKNDQGIICDSCSHFVGKYSFCEHFKRDINEQIIECKYQQIN